MPAHIVFVIPTDVQRRCHLRHDGRPKQGFTKDEARTAAAELRERLGRPYSPYLCHCGDWHAGVWRARRRYRADLDFLELGDRVTSWFKHENGGSWKHRRKSIRLRYARKARQRSEALATG